MARTLKARLEALEESRAVAAVAAERLASKRAMKAQDPEWEAQFSQLTADFLSCWLRPEFDTPPEEVRCHAHEHARQQAEMCRVLGRPDDPARTAAAADALAEWVSGLSAPEWCDCMTRAGYELVYRDRIARASAGAGSGSAGGDDECP